jgi:8-oxo-dGTP diphosphatase
MLAPGLQRIIRYEIDARAMAKKKAAGPTRARDMLQPNLTVDAIVLDGMDRLLLVERGKDPYRGRFALPGGFVEYGETVEHAVVRELEEETGLNAEVAELVGVYSDPDRDPRGHTVTIVFRLEVVSGEPKAGDDAVNARFFPLKGLPPLAFDHDRIVSEFLAKRHRR